MYIDNNKNLGFFSINSKLQLLFTPIYKASQDFLFLLNSDCVWLKEESHTPRIGGE